MIKKVPVKLRMLFDCLNSRLNHDLLLVYKLRLELLLNGLDGRINVFFELALRLAGFMLYVIAENFPVVIHSADDGLYFCLDSHRYFFVEHRLVVCILIFLFHFSLN